MGKCLHVRACVLAPTNASRTQPVIVFAAAFDFRSSSQLGVRPDVSAIEQQP